jgi:putative (di)nucleoside polyphosphate hydrolase
VYTEEDQYRAGVGIMLINKQGLVFLAKRKDFKEHIFSPWQMPQGGIDEGETPEITAFRELKEEIGTNNAKIMEISQHWHYYDFPPHVQIKVWNGRYLGQKHKWFLMLFLGEDAEIDLETHHPEFCEWKWVPLDEVMHLVMSFKKDVYQKVIEEFSGFIKALEN